MEHELDDIAFGFSDPDEYHSESGRVSLSIDISLLSWIGTAFDENSLTVLVTDEQPRPESSSHLKEDIGTLPKRLIKVRKKPDMPSLSDTAEKRLDGIHSISWRNNSEY